MNRTFSAIKFFYFGEVGMFKSCIVLVSQMIVLKYWRAWFLCLSMIVPIICGEKKKRQLEKLQRNERQIWGEYDNWNCINLHRRIFWGFFSSFLYLFLIKCMETYFQTCTILLDQNKISITNNSFILSETVECLS